MDNTPRNAVEAFATRYTESYVAVLGAAFARVQNAENWKFAIDAWVTLAPCEQAILHDAIIFYTGSVPTFKDDAEGKTHVTAAGYYAAIGS